ncbi:hypothetical protein LCGC14_1324020 [marine sediment metagenome]|uniref:Uncharacterized protein n=1 Tax=marine sediment metagenome TaxID=412755 RepID=A0A0F9KJ60_9ZZZZ
MSKKLNSRDIGVGLGKALIGASTLAGIATTLWTLGVLMCSNVFACEPLYAGKLGMVGFGLGMVGFGVAIGFLIAVGICWVIGEAVTEACKRANGRA